MADRACGGGAAWTQLVDVEGVATSALEAKQIGHQSLPPRRRDVRRGSFRHPTRPRMWSRSRGRHADGASRTEVIQVRTLVVRHQLAAFFVLAFAFSWAAWTVPALGYRDGIGAVLFIAGTFGPLAAAAVVTARGRLCLVLVQGALRLARSAALVCVCVWRADRVCRARDGRVRPCR